MIHMCSYTHSLAFLQNSDDIFPHIDYSNQISPVSFLLALLPLYHVHGNHTILTRNLPPIACGWMQPISNLTSH